MSPGDIASHPWFIRRATNEHFLYMGFVAFDIIACVTSFFAHFGSSAVTSLGNGYVRCSVGARENPLENKGARYGCLT
jgi:hypothetical protein